MIFFFDYLYMQCSFYYKAHKSERNLDMWKISASAAVAGSTAFVIWFVNILIYDFFIQEYFGNDAQTNRAIHFFLSIITIVLFILLMIIFGIRYSRFITYEQIVGKVRKLSKPQKVFLHIMVLIYLFTSLPLLLLYVICTGPIH